MRITIFPPHHIYEVGGRANNEDYLYPVPDGINKATQLFLVCDGVGGAEKGEVASKLAANSFAQFFKENPTVTVDEVFITKALDFAEAQFDDYLRAHPNAKSMGTTLALLHFNEQGAAIAHIGDSRVYHIRNGEILSITDDHSLVNELVKAEIITAEDALTHPKRNVITRAIQGKSVKPTKATVELITDIEPDDYFFLCSDGILENVDDDLLQNILGKEVGDEIKVKQIKEKCAANPRDNYTAYLVKVKEVEGVANLALTTEEVLIASEATVATSNYPEERTYTAEIIGEEMITQEAGVELEVKENNIKEEIEEPTDNEEEEGTYNLSHFFLFLMVLVLSLITFKSLFNRKKEPVANTEEIVVLTETTPIKESPRKVIKREKNIKKNGELKESNQKKLFINTDVTEDLKIATDTTAVSAIPIASNSSALELQLDKKEGTEAVKTQENDLTDNEEEKMLKPSIEEIAVLSTTNKPKTKTNKDKLRERGIKAFGVFSEKRLAVIKNGKFGFVNNELVLITSFDFDEVKEFRNGYAAVRKMGKWTFIDSNGNTITNRPDVIYSFLEVGFFSKNGLAPVKTSWGDKKWGYINDIGKMVIGYHYDKAGEFNALGRAKVEKEGDSFIIDENDNCLEDCPNN